MKGYRVCGLLADWTCSVFIAKDTHSERKITARSETLTWNLEILGPILTNGVFKDSFFFCYCYCCYCKCYLCMSLSQLIPLHIELEVKQKAWLLFSASLWDGWTVILFFFLELMCKVVTRCIMFFLLEYNTCGFVREVFRVGGRRLSLCFGC